jgi:rod shape-determining protein MreC
LLVPVVLWEHTDDYAGGLQAALASEAAARRALAVQAERAGRVEQLLSENERLRELLDLRSSFTVKSQAAEVLYESTDPYSRKVVIDRGQTQGLVAGSPVITEAGVIGQLTRLYPLSSEVTLLVDKDAAVPVLNVRTGSRSVALGSASGDGLELRFMAGNADVQVGDELRTSGIDGVYPPGLPVARVVDVERKSQAGFARIRLLPVASPDAVRHVLVLEPIGLQQPPPIPPEAASEPGHAAPHKQGARR